MSEQQVDGRRARGERRRQAILEATLRVIERDGVAGVSHRSVAREAGVPTTSTTYYFASLDDLLIATLMWSADKLAEDISDLIVRLVNAPNSDVGAVTRRLVDMVDANRGRTMAEYELYLLAARRPELRPAARRWLDLITEAARPFDSDPVAFRAFLAAVDGLLMQGLIADEPPSVADLEPVVSYLIRPRQHLDRLQGGTIGE
ncbi:TetR/AcrR family transcriptional regulator [Umezawaea endophytica]|uniref:TetR family transcriptional regulator n=1 Tax=Umezawaea endophytica TaxID=1654476 RepID=A0A9X2VQJ9_9PSEU|nr:TetR family transcriptional regulator [Umezawaea endophytica]MCS7480784.1 TetR family transcriptional regulator [Umezawaea endophytica]